MFKGHVLIIGMTGSGKTSLLKYEIIPSFRKAGFKSAVLSPLNDPSFGADFVTTNNNEFIRFAYSNSHYVLCVDESGRAVGRYDSLMQSLATDIRHKGNLSVFATQGVTQLAPIVRDQCAYVFVFACSRRNFENIAESFDKPELLKFPKLKEGEFYFVPRFGEIRKGIIEFTKRKVTYSTPD